MASNQCTIEQLALKGKKGACFTLREKGKDGSWEKNMPRVLSLRPHWYYCWGHQPGEGCPQPKNMDFLPMFWGCHPKNFAMGLECCKEQEPKMILGFNEPDAKAQSNLSVEKALEAWPKLQELGFPLVSPSCAHIMNQPWMDQFMKQVEEQGLRVDVVGVHSYGNANPNAFKKKLQTIYEKYRRPIIVTEFAVADWKAASPENNKCKPAKVLKFMQEVVPWMEEQEWVLGYAWFAFPIDHRAGCCSALFDAQGGLTELGRFYADFEPNPDVEVCVA